MLMGTTFLENSLAINTKASLAFGLVLWPFNLGNNKQAQGLICKDDRSKKGIESVPKEALTVGRTLE